MSNYQRIFDLADRALHRAKFDQRLGAETRKERQELIEYCRDRIRERIAQGQSEDCDEYRVLLKLERSHTAA